MTSIRAVSWWLIWNDLSWPNPDIADKFKRRADQMVKSNANTAIIFGAHFRWDFMPLWLQLHDMMKFIADELHQRDIKLFDHHSSVLTHRYSNPAEMLAMRQKNRHHLPFAPSRDIAATWNYNDSLLNDWRMIDIATGKPVFLERYTAEEFCMNSPAFVAAYQRYLKKLLPETGIDGLMSDDAIFYSGFTSCGCQHCREKFQQQYGHDLPPVDNLDFWENWQNTDFKDWIEFRYQTTGNFMAKIKACLPKEFTLMSCCSSSSKASNNQTGIDYQQFIDNGCNSVMLEICGNLPDIDGNLDRHLASQLHHIALANQYHLPCIGLGYGYYTATADLVWAFNKFIGSDSWVSTLKGRLGLSDDQMTELPDDAEIVANGYNFEAAHPELFITQSDAKYAIMFSDSTRRYYGGYNNDYVADYQQLCDLCFTNGITADVVTTIPKSDDYEILIIASVNCLSSSERTALDQFIAYGGKVVACGPFALLDNHGSRTETQYLTQFDLEIELTELNREPQFPNDLWQEQTPAQCRNAPQWYHPHPNLYWHPQRLAAVSESLVKLLIKLQPLEPVTPLTSNGWHLRRYKTQSDTIIIHGLVANYNQQRNEALEAQRQEQAGMSLITAISPKGQSRTLQFTVNKKIKTAELFMPLLNQHLTLTINTGKVNFALPDNCYYFILKLNR